MLRSVIMPHNEGHIRFVRGFGVSASDFRAALASRAILDWLESAEGQMNHTSFKVRAVGRAAGHVFKVTGDLRTEEVGFDPHLTLEPDTVAVIIRIVCGENSFILGLEQTRPGVSANPLREIVAGRTDGHDPRKVALAESREETTGYEGSGGIQISDAMLRFLGSYHPSPGGGREVTHLFSADVLVTRAQVASLSGRLTGRREEGEKITLHLVEEDNFIAWLHECGGPVCAKAALAFKLAGFGKG